MPVLPLLDELSTWNMISGSRSRDYKAKDKGEEAGEGQQVEGRQAEIYQIDMDHAAKVLISVASTIIPAAELKVPAATITTALVKVVAASTRRRREVVIRDP
nr:hypothetical protein [Tanacetum cinerariifolium]